METCDRTGSWVERLRGGTSSAEAGALDAHAVGCAACAAERDEIRSALGLLSALPEFAPATSVWPALARRLPVPRPFSTALRLAAAAAVLAAVASFLFAGGATRGAPLPIVLGSAAPLRWGEIFRAERFCSIAVPGVGTLRLDRGSALRFEHPRLAVLEAGEVFAEIEPSGRGFELRSSGAAARVHGTRFGVRAPETVYVVEGSVEVRSAGAVLTVGARMVDLSAEDHLQWLARHEHAPLRLVLDPGAHARVTAGAPLRWTLRLESDALVPVLLGGPRELSQYFSLIVDGHVVPLDASGVRLVEAAPADGGLLRCDAAHPVTVECAVDPALFRSRGRVAVRGVFTSGVHDLDRVWVGTIRSPSVNVEVE
jgi:ferric-dicitrate binding protein FerR (iron transport regulator)